MNEALLWILDLVRSVDPVARTLLAGLGIFLETSLLVGLIVPGDTIVLVAATAVETPMQYAALLVAVILGARGGESVGFALGREQVVGEDEIDLARQHEAGGVGRGAANLEL